MDRKYIDHAGDSKNPQDLLLRGGQQQVKPCAPGMISRTHQRCQSTGVDELQALQIDYDSSLACRDHGQ